jgi:hypothetical protein
MLGSKKSLKSWRKNWRIKTKVKTATEHKGTTPLGLEDPKTKTAGF